MALIKSKAIDLGYSAEYWRLVQLNWNVERNDFVAEFALYKDKMLREENPTAIVETQQVILGSKFSQLLTGIDPKQPIADRIKACAYESLKTMATEEAAKVSIPDAVIREEIKFFADAVSDVIIIKADEPVLITK